MGREVALKFYIFVRLIFKELTANVADIREKIDCDVNILSEGRTAVDSSVLRIRDQIIKRDKDYKDPTCDLGNKHLVTLRGSSDQPTQEGSDHSLLGEAKSAYGKNGASRDDYRQTDASCAAAPPDGMDHTKHNG